MVVELTDLVVNAVNNTTNATADAGGDVSPWYLLIPFGAVALSYLALYLYRKWELPERGEMFYRKGSTDAAKHDDFDDEIYAHDREFGRVDRE